MAALALKAVAFGAERIPDTAFEKIPGVGRHFTPAEKKKMRDDRNKREAGHRSKDKEAARRRSNRPQSSPPDRQSGRSPSDDDSSDSNSDSERRRHRHHRRRASRSVSRSVSRSRDPRQAKHEQRAREREERHMMGRDEHEEPYFPPPPTGEYAPRPYNPAEYAAPAAAAVGGAALGHEYYPPPVGGNEYYPPPQQSYAPAYAPSPALHPGTAHPVSHSAARYTPAGYSPPNSATLAPSPTGYAPYNPADYALVKQASPAAPGNAYPTPPAFYRQPSHSQPSLDHHHDNELAVADAPSRHDSARSSHRHKRRSGAHSHRTRSVGSGRSRSRITDQVRDRLDKLNLDPEDKKLAAGAVGALAGGLAGNQVRHGTLSTLVGMAIGGYGGASLEKRREKSRKPRDISGTDDRSNERSKDHRDRDSRGDDRKRHASRRSRGGDHREYDSYDSSPSDSESDGHQRSERRRNKSKGGRRGRDRSPDSF